MWRSSRIWDDGADQGSYETQLLLDQSQLDCFDNNYTIKSFMPMGQEFVPSESTLAAIAVDLGSANPHLGDDVLTLRLRGASIHGAVLATATQWVGADFAGVLDFVFPNPLWVEPGQRYVIDLEATTGTHEWRACDSDAYPDGASIFHGQRVPQRDLRFETLALAASGS